MLIIALNWISSVYQAITYLVPSSIPLLTRALYGNVFSSTPCGCLAWPFNLLFKSPCQTWFQIPRFQCSLDTHFAGYYSLWRMGKSPVTCRWDHHYFIHDSLPTVYVPYFSLYEYTTCFDYSWTEYLLGGAVVVTVCSILIILAILFRDISTRQSVITAILAYLASDVHEDIRKSFRALKKHVFTPKPFKNHPHGQAAANRAMANNIIDVFIKRIKRTRYDFQTSAKIGARTKGFRSWIFAKDLTIQPKYDHFDPHKHIFTMIDVDYYVDMPQLMDGRTLVLYTFVPQGVATTTLNGRYHFTENDVVKYTVNGGASYKHKLWDYRYDDYYINHWWGSVAYHCDRIKTSEDRFIILLSPIRTIYTPISYRLHGNPIKRMRVVFGGMSLKENNDVVSISGVNGEPEVTVPRKTIESAFTRLSASKAPHISDVERLFKVDKVDDYLYAATVFFTHFKQWTPSQVPMTMETDDFSYQSLGPLATEDGRTSMRSIGTAYTRGFAPVLSYNNDEACVLGRLTNVRNTMPCPTFAEGMMEEFVTQCVRRMETDRNLAPLSYEAYRTRVNKSTTKLKLDSVEYFNLAREVATIKSFQKREAYAKMSDPRNISTLDAAHNATLGQFMYPLADQLKKLHFYGPGRSPQGVSQAVQSKLLWQTYVVSSDVSRMDGSVSLHLREVYEHLMIASFAEAYESEIQHLLTAEENATGSTAHGVRYKAKGSILSGSSITSQLGTIINAYISYCTLRYDKFDPEVAFDNLGFYFGDDGLTCYINPQSLRYVSAQFGMLFKAEVINQNEPLKYLGRIYADPWVSGEAITQVDRQLTKLNLTEMPINVPTEVILRRRAQSYMITDPNTPIIKEWSTRVLHFTDKFNPLWERYQMLAAKEDSYWIRFEDTFMPPTYETALPLVADSLGIATSDVLIICDRLSRAASISELFFKIIDKQPVVTIPCTYEGQSIQPAEGPTHNEQVEAHKSIKPQKSNVCRHFLKGNCNYKNCQFSHEGLSKSGDVPAEKPP